MKHLIIILLFLSCGVSYSQDFKAHFATGTYGLNPKIKFQLELPIKRWFSYGIEGTYFLDERRGEGPVVAPFLRMYPPLPKGNAKGFFIQGKYMYGVLQGEYLNDLSQWENFSFNTNGFGVGIGRKGVFFKRLTWEPYIGIRDVSGPEIEAFVDGSSRFTGWRNWTGSRIDFQFKIGYQIPN